MSVEPVHPAIANSPESLIDDRSHRFFHMERSGSGDRNGGSILSSVNMIEVIYELIVVHVQLISHVLSFYIDYVHAKYIVGACFLICVFKLSTFAFKSQNLNIPKQEYIPKGHPKRHPQSPLRSPAGTRTSAFRFEGGTLTAGAAGRLPGVRR